MLRFGLVGCGAIAKRHADLLSTGSVKGATLSAVCDIDKEKASAFGAKYKVPCYSSIQEMLDSHNVDVTSVLTPSGQHAADVIVLASYRNPIVVEKPMALTLDDADRMIEACDRYGTRLFVIKQNRFNRPVTALRRLLDEGRLGRLVMGTVRVRWCRTQSYYDAAPWRGTWAHDGGVLANQASHHLDLLEWMMGDVESVVAMSTHALARIEAEDTAAAVLRFRSGALGVIEATTATRPKDLEGSLSVLGEFGADRDRRVCR
jgi:UDP-N-acetyl-2-amino-2-deoxyglucuronate dehydrogenase